jgi:hypothetical protein
MQGLRPQAHSPHRCLKHKSYKRLEQKRDESFNTEKKHDTDKQKPNLIGQTVPPLTLTIP